MLKRIAIGFIGLCVLGGLGFLALAWRSSIAPIDPPATADFPRELIAKGEALAGAGYCATCHTAKGGATYAGGYGMPTPFGIIYSTNITPDPQESIISKAMSTSGLGISQEPDPDARLYVAACGSCHYNSGAPLEVRPELALNTALTSPEPTNFIRVVLDGIGIRDGMPGVMMPGFGRALSDPDIARLAAYLRRTRTELPAWTNIESKVAAIRKERAASQ